MATVVVSPHFYAGLEDLATPENQYRARTGEPIEPPIYTPYKKAPDSMSMQRPSDISPRIWAILSRGVTDDAKMNRIVADHRKNHAPPRMRAGVAALYSALSDDTSLSAMGLSNKSGLGDELDVAMGLTRTSSTKVEYDGVRLTLGAPQYQSKGKAPATAVAATTLPNRSGHGAELDSMMGVHAGETVPGVRVVGNVLQLGVSVSAPPRKTATLDLVRLAQEVG
ncbi:MAG TPA: hypothetical protein VH062_35700 [Polyangiaceae bacterium]|jgi:hypothetical protein|nr:hypothetical protein [Polyangiaceae bacterium]